MSLLPLKRKVRALSWQLRQVKLIAKAMHSRYHPIVAHVIPVRRCNLACAYCNEYDKVSQPVPTEVMLRRIDQLHELGTTIITFSGGEPLLHPDLDDLIRRIRSHSCVATLITTPFQEALRDVAVTENDAVDGAEVEGWRQLYRSPWGGW